MFAFKAGAYPIEVSYEEENDGDRMMPIQKIKILTSQHFQTFIFVLKWACAIKLFTAAINKVF
jgi:hypothetical protein